MDASLADVVAALHDGGVVAYPTEAVYGLGCDPHNRDACARLFAIKQRPTTQGVLLIAAEFAALCRGFGGALVSTSANRHGEPPALAADQVRAMFGDEVDAILNGPLGGLERPTPIRDAISGMIVRS